MVNFIYETSPVEDEKDAIRVNPKALLQHNPPLQSIDRSDKVEVVASAQNIPSRFLQHKHNVMPTSKRMKMAIYERT